jgi:hypothetical protein
MGLDVVLGLLGSEGEAFSFLLRQKVNILLKRFSPKITTIWVAIPLRR